MGWCGKTDLGILRRTDQAKLLSPPASKDNGPSGSPPAWSTGHHGPLKAALTAAGSLQA